MFARLLDMTDAQVLQVLAVVMAETLAAGTDLIDTLGQRLRVDCLQHWQPDETFFALVKDREAVSGMLAEVIGETAASSYLTEPGTKKKAIIRKALAGDGRTKVENWTPRYMAFPQAPVHEPPLGGRSGRRRDPPCGRVQQCGAAARETSLGCPWINPAQIGAMCISLAQESRMPMSI